MKRILSAFLLTLSLSTQAGLPPTTLSGQSATSNITTFNFKTPYNQATKITGGTLIETGNANVLADPGAEALFTPWSAYKDAAGVLPVDGTGGTPDYISCINSSTSPLAGTKSFLITKQVAANAQGEGCSIPFTIPTSSTFKVNRLSFDYAIASGTYTDDQVEWFVYDVTNATVKPFTPSKLKNHSLPSETFAPNGEFQASDSTSYRLIAHVASTSAANEWALKFDNFKLGVFEKTYGSVVTDEKNFTPTGTWTTGTYKGKWSQSADKMKVSISFVVSSAPTGNFTVDLPSGYLIDTAKLASGAITNSESIGTGLILDSSTSTRYLVDVSVNSTSSVRIVSHASAAIVSPTVPMTFASSDSIELTFEVPIAGWSSSQIMSNDADTRRVSFGASRITSTQSLGTAATEVIFNNSREDSHSSYSTSNGRYTAKLPGKFSFNAGVGLIMGATAATNVTVYFLKNGTGGQLGTYYNDSLTNSRFYSAKISADIEMVAGDYVSVWVASTGQAVSASFNATGDDSSFYGKLISSPSQITASDSVSFSANTSTTAATTSAPFIYTVEDHDTHNAYSTVTGKFTAPSAGKYFCTFNTFSATSFYITLIKNGTTIYEGTNSGGSQSAVGSHVMSLLSGDTLEVRPSGAATAAGGADNNNFSCFRMGI